METKSYCTKDYIEHIKIEGWKASCRLHRMTKKNTGYRETKR